MTKKKPPRGGAPPGRRPEKRHRKAYHDARRVFVEAMGDFYVAAAELLRAGPWQWVGPEQAVRIDIPVLGVEGAAVCVMDVEQETRGILICPSEPAWHGFLDAAAEPSGPAGSLLERTMDWVALAFVRDEGLPADSRREAEAHGWPAAELRAWPVVQRGMPRWSAAPADLRDVLIATTCARALASFCVEHAALFAAEPGAEVLPASEVLWGSEIGDVIVTAPYDAFDLFDHQAPEDPELLDALFGVEDGGLEDPEWLGPVKEAPAPEAPPPDGEQTLHAIKRRHYTDWLDHPLAALGGRSPRQAVRTAHGSREVDLLLQEMQRQEARLAGDDPVYDLAWLRRMLGLRPEVGGR